MPKPSIFSKDYEEKMRKRRIRRIILILSLILVVLLITFRITTDKNIGEGIKYSLNGVKEKVTSIPNTKNNEEKKENNSNVKEDTVKNNIKENKKQVKEEVPKEYSYNIKLSNGKEVRLLYKNINNKKTYTEVLPKGISYDVSPSKKNIVIIEDKTQNMILVDINGVQKNITKMQYVSSKGDIFKKDNIVKNNPNYIWNSSPKFSNEDNIIFVSQLPWFNKENQKYLWKYNISTNKHYYNLSSKGGEITGIDIKYGKVTPEGLEVIVDGVNNIIK